MAFSRLSTIRGALALAIGALVTVSPAQVFAQAGGTRGQNITLTPSSTQLSIDPGKSGTEAFEIINSGDQSSVVTATSSPYNVSGIDYDPKFTQLPGTTDASKWVKLSNTKQQTLAGRQTLTINYTVSVPAGTAPGGYYAVLFAEATPANVPKGGVVSRTRVGNILYITVNGPVKSAGTVKADELPVVQFKEGLAPSVLVSNTGGVHFQSDTKISVKNILGKTVYDVTLQRFILPQTSRQIAGDWNRTPPIGIYKVSRSASVPGKTVTLDDKWIVIVRPYVLVALLVFIVAVTALYLGKRRLRKK